MEVSYSRNEIRRNILSLAWPTITEQLLVMMVGIVSTILVARLGKESMAAVGMVNNLVNFFQTIFAGLATGTTIIIARITGESGVQKAKSALMQSLLMGAVFGLIFTAICMYFSEDILKLFFGSAEKAVLEKGLLYYRFILISIPLMILDMLIAGGLRGAGDTKTPLYVTIIVNIINAVLSVTLIFGMEFGSFISIPSYGVKGAAIAVMTARICGGVMRIALLFWKKSKINFTLKDRFKLNTKVMKRIIRVGIPSFMENLIMQGGFLVIQVMVVAIGTVQSAAYQIGGNIHSLAFMPIFGFAITTTTTVGQNLGRQDYEKAEIYAYENKQMAIMVGVCAGLLEFILAEPLARLYSTDPDVIRVSMIVVRGFALIEPFMGIEKVSAAAMRAAGDIKYVLVTAVVALWSFRILIALILTKFTNLGIYGIMVGIFLDFSVRAIMYIVRMKKGKWKYMRV